MTATVDTTTEIAKEKTSTWKKILNIYDFLYDEKKIHYKIINTLTELVFFIVKIIVWLIWWVIKSPFKLLLFIFFPSKKVRTKRKIAALDKELERLDKLEEKIIRKQERERKEKERERREKITRNRKSDDAAETAVDLLFF